MSSEPYPELPRWFEEEMKEYIEEFEMFKEELKKELESCRGTEGGA